MIHRFTRDFDTVTRVGMHEPRVQSHRRCSAARHRWIALRRRCRREILAPPRNAVRRIEGEPPSSRHPEECRGETRRERTGNTAERVIYARVGGTPGTYARR